jgi:hypothetical protein
MNEEMEQINNTDEKRTRSNILKLLNFRRKAKRKSVASKDRVRIEVSYPVFEMYVVLERLDDNISLYYHQLISSYTAQNILCSRTNLHSMDISSLTSHHDICSPVFPL